MSSAVSPAASDAKSSVPATDEGAASLRPLPRIPSSTTVTSTFSSRSASSSSSSSSSSSARRGAGVPLRFGAPRPRAKRLLLDGRPRHVVRHLRLTDGERDRRALGTPVESGEERGKRTLASAGLGRRRRLLGDDGGELGDGTRVSDVADAVHRGVGHLFVSLFLRVGVALVRRALALLQRHVLVGSACGRKAPARPQRGMKRTCSMSASATKRRDLRRCADPGGTAPMRISGALSEGRGDLGIPGTWRETRSRQPPCASSRGTWRGRLRHRDVRLVSHHRGDGGSDDVARRARVRRGTRGGRRPRATWPRAT